MKPRYLGDAVYASVDEFGRLILTTDSHLPADANNMIVLEPEVLAQLRAYLDDFDAEREHPR